MILKKGGCITVIALQICLRVCHQEGSGKLGWLEIKWYNQLLVHADDVNILGGSVHTVQKFAEASVVASKENGLEVNVDKTKCMIMSRDQNARQSQNVKTYNESFKWLEQFKYLEQT